MCLTNRISRKGFACSLAVLLILVACQPTPHQATITATAPVDCEELWNGEAIFDDPRLAFSLGVNQKQFDFERLNNHETNEKLLATIVLKNKGSTPIWVNERMGVNDQGSIDIGFGELSFILIAPWGEKASFIPMVNAGEPERNDFQLLAPGDAIQDQTPEILSYKFLSLRQQESRITYPVGRYCVWAVYQNQIDPGLDGFVWKGKLKSNLVEFEVIQ